MNNKELNQELYNKLVEEENRFIEDLKKRTVEDILMHGYAFEYTMRQDILFVMEYLELSDAQVRALLMSETPLEDLYRRVSARVSYIEDMEACIDETATLMANKISEEDAAWATRN